MYLLDTNIVSLLDPRRKERPVELLDWLRRNDERIFASAITLTELEAGVLKIIRSGEPMRAAHYAKLRDRVIDDFGARILPVTVPVALEVARIAESIRPMVIERTDLIIAATAMVHGLTVLTRNLRHFTPTGVPSIDPLATLPPG